MGLHHDHNHSHDHDHSHVHSHAHDHRGQSRKRLTVTLALVVTYMVAEVVGGLLSNSLALLADAGHMLSDAAALGLALFAMWLSQKESTPRHTFGYYRTEILAALANGAALVAISIFIFAEAWQRFADPPGVQGPLMLGIAAGGLVINLIGLFVLHGGIEESLNMRGAWLHVLADTLGSAGALVAAGLIWAFGWNWADPLASVFIAVLVVGSSWTLLKESVNVLMEGAPGHLDVDEIRDALLSIDGVESVHCLHVWTITSGMVALSAHLDADDSWDQAELLAHVRGLLEERFGIEHTTLQIEPPGFEHGPACI